jgi:hypothetical protein
MPTENETLQVKEFLKRAEIKTMRKDLRALREFDALKERDKIVKIKTLEEQRLEQAKKLAEKEKLQSQTEQIKREGVLEKNAVTERLAEKDLKEYATEQERQQIFQFEAQRLSFGKQADAIDREKDPALKLQKNGFLIEKRNWEEKLKSVLDQEKKLEDEQNFIAQKSQQSTIGPEKKSLEQRRAEIDVSIQEIEKKRWEIEKQLEGLEKKIKDADASSEQLAQEKNSLKQKILGIDKSLRDMYSGVIARVEEKRRNEAQEKKFSQEALSKVRLEQKEQVQRQQRPQVGPQQNKDSFASIPVPVKEKILGTTPSEEEQRKKFIQDVESWAENKSNVPIVPKK